MKFPASWRAEFLRKLRTMVCLVFKSLDKPCFVFNAVVNIDLLVSAIKADIFFFIFLLKVIRVEKLYNIDLTLISLVWLLAESETCHSARLVDIHVSKNQRRPITVLVK